MLRFTTPARRWMSSTSKKRYAVLIAGHPPASIAAQHGDYGTVIINMLRQSDEHEDWLTYKVVDDEFPSDDELKEIDALVISGSKHDAHADLPWINKLKELIVNVSADPQKKLLGICFGHQAAAIALGGDSGRSQCGWELGVKSMTFTSAFQKKFGSAIIGPTAKLLEVHRDQVLKLPERARLLASSERTLVEMFSFNDNVLCLQGHPELNEEIVSELIRSRRDAGVLSDQEADEALESLKNGTDNETIRSFLKSFIHS